MSLVLIADPHPRLVRPPTLCAPPPFRCVSQKAQRTLDPKNAPMILLLIVGVSDWLPFALTCSLGASVGPSSRTAPCQVRPVLPRPRISPVTRPSRTQTLSGTQRSLIEGSTTSYRPQVGRMHPTDGAAEPTLIAYQAVRLDSRL